MWFVIGGLTFAVSAVSALLFGRLLAKASSEQTSRPNVVRGPSLEADLQARRLMIAEQGARRRNVEVHLN
jgi:hypothetical protein